MAHEIKYKVRRPEEKRTNYELTFIYEVWSEFDKCWCEDVYHTYARDLDKAREIIEKDLYAKRHPGMTRTEIYIRKVEYTLIQKA